MSQVYEVMQANKFSARSIRDESASQMDRLREKAPVEKTQLICLAALRAHMSKQSKKE